MMHTLAATAPGIDGSASSLLLLLAVIALMPFVLAMVTSFAKLVVVAGIVRQAVGTPQFPPTVVVIGLAIVLSLHVMTPVGVAVYRDYESSSRLVAVASFPQTGQRWREVQGSLDTQPGGFSAEELQNLGGMSLDQLLADSSEAGSRARKALADDAAIRQLRPNPPAKGASGMDVRAFRISVEGPMDRFLLRHSSAKNIELFQRLSARLLKAQGLDESAVSPTVRRFAVHAPAFVATELTEAFIIGLLIFIPFVVIDLVVSSILLSVGMPGLSPGMLSLPLKLLVFVMMNGWGLIMRGLVLGYA